MTDRSGTRPLALVTGASSGIGRAYAERLASEGFDLLVVARRRERLEELRDRLEAERRVAVEVLAADLSTTAGMGEVERRASDRPLEMLVDNAALAHYMPFVDLLPEQVEELVKLNALGPARLIRAALPGMVARGHGTVVSIATQLVFSAAADGPYLPQRALYAATKAFLFTLIRVLATELHGTGVRVQVVCPGIVRSEFHTRQGMDLTDRPRLEPEQVVQASMRGLELGEIVCQPGLEDTDVMKRRDQADLDVLASGMQAELASRYREATVES